jgi:hypothetical protein
MTDMTGLTPKARSLVQAGRSAFRPTAGDRERIEAALRTQLGPGALPLDAGGTGLSGSAGWHTVARVALGVCVIGGAAFLALRPGASTPVPRAGRSTHLLAASPAPMASNTPEPTPSAAPTVETSAPAAASSKVPVSPAPHRPDRLAQEVALLSRATAELRAGHADQALKALDEHQRRFPSGALSEDRRAAKAEALCSLGRVNEGRAELAHLAPQSPAAAHAKRVCDSASVADQQP